MTQAGETLVSRKVNFIDCTLSRELCTGRQSYSLIAFAAMPYCANFLATYKLTRIEREEYLDEYFIACDVVIGIFRHFKAIKLVRDTTAEQLYISCFATKAANVVR